MAHTVLSDELRDYYTGRCAAAIEAVTLTWKPLAEVGEIPCGDGQVSEVREFLAACIARFGDNSVKPYVRETVPGRCAFGFYVFPWVLSALEFIKSGGRPFEEDDRHWIQGLMYGYSPGAIQKFVTTSGSDE